MRGSIGLVLMTLACGGRVDPTDAGASGGGAAAGGQGGGSAGGAAGGAASPGDSGLPGGEYDRSLSAFPSRGYDLIVPTARADGGYPVIFLLHGGGGTRAAARRTTCPGGVTTAPECFDRLAPARGFALVVPEGTGNLLRTWNAGGGSNGWQCVSGAACTSRVDEAAYVSAVIADLTTLIPLDRSRFYATGLSNGGAMAERLACERPEISAIASVAAGNQWSTTAACTRAASVLEIHGTADPCWSWDGGPLSCADTNPGSKVSVADTIARWSQNDGCDGGEALTALPDTQSDGTTTTRHVYACSAAALELYEVRDGGHTWPSGYSFGSNGLTATDWSANSVILDFFSAH